jgi:hypothetical protein
LLLPELAEEVPNQRPNQEPNHGLWAGPDDGVVTVYVRAPWSVRLPLFVGVKVTVPASVGRIENV